MSLSETENTHQNSAAGAGATADFADPALGISSRGSIDFLGADGVAGASINGATIGSVTRTMTAVAPNGRAGERIAVRVAYYLVISMGTSYVYEWQAEPVVTETTTEATSESSGQNPTVTETAAPTELPVDEVKIPLHVTLSVKQAITPPARTIDLRPNKDFLKKLLGQGSAVLTLECTVEGIPDNMGEPVRVSFEIDQPSKIVGPARRIVVTENQASTQFVFNRSEAAGQDGSIFTSVQYPAFLEKVERPICAFRSDSQKNDQNQASLQ